MIGINLYFRDDSLWNIRNTTYVRGNAFLEEKLLEGVEISKLISVHKTVRDFEVLLKRLNGFFSIIHEQENELFIAVDRMRSYPLFYGMKNGELFISDDPHWIREHIDNENVDDLSAREFLLTGYVTGKDTLYTKIKQLNAGEMLSVAETPERMNLVLKRYYRYKPGDYFKKTQEELYAELDQVLSRVFKRLVKWADGRTIVIPLSGGYDSRLNVLMLKQMGYDNLMTFTYGKPNNEESEISKKVAESLGIEWEFVPYSNEAWYKWYHSDEFISYSRMASGLCSVPHIQDWPAVWELKKRGVIPENSIFVSGGGVIDFGTTFYPADKEAYYHIRPKSASENILFDCKTRGMETIGGSSEQLYNEKVIDWEEFINIIFKKRYRLWDWSDQKNILGPKFEEKINMIAEMDNCYGADNVIDAVECWDWQELEAKFYVNSVRVYEFWGYKWWLPLWDSEFVDFWSRLPISDRLGRSLYKSYVKNLSMKIAKKNIEANPHEISEKMTSKFLNIIDSSPLKTIYRLYRKNRLYMNYTNHPFAWYGILPEEKFREIYTGKESINSFLSLAMLEDLMSAGRNSILDNYLHAEKNNPFHIFEKDSEELV